MHSSRAQHARRASASAALVAAVALGLGGCTAGDTTASPGATVGGGAATAHPTAGPAGGTGTGSGATSGAATGAGGAGSSSGSGTGRATQPAPTPTDPGTEIIPTATPTPYRLPGLAAAKKAATAPLVAKAPKTASAHGRVVAGFPTSAVPLPRGLTIVSSSVASQGRHVQVSLQASSDASWRSVRSRLTSALTERGYTATTAAATAGTAAVQYTHGTDGVVVTLHKRLGGGTELTLTGSFTAAG